MYLSLLKNFILELKELLIFKEMRYVKHVLEQEQKTVNLNLVLNAMGKEWCSKMFKWQECFKCKCKLSVQSVMEKVIFIQKNAKYVKERKLSKVTKH